jgi:hypothetical protein
MSSVNTSAIVNGDNLRRFRPALAATIAVLHLCVAAIAYEAQGHFYTALLHAPANLGYGLADIALQPATFAITAAIAAVVAAAYLLATRLRISWVVLPLAALVASVTTTAAALGADADAKAAQVEAGRPACSGAFTPYRLCVQRVFVSRVSGANLSWLTSGGDQALYLGDWSRSYVLIDPTSHKTYSVPQQDVALAWPLT